MLNLKKLLMKLCEKVNYRTVTMSAQTSAAIAAGAIKRINIPLPASGTVIGVTGYYISGSTLMLVYGIELGREYTQIAVRNIDSSTGTITPQLTYIVVD